MAVNGQGQRIRNRTESGVLRVLVGTGDMHTPSQTSELAFLWLGFLPEGIWGHQHLTREGITGEGMRIKVRSRLGCPAKLCLSYICPLLVTVCVWRTSHGVLSSLTYYNKVG